MAKQMIKSSFLGTCPVCRNKFKSADAKIVSKNESASLYCVKCKECLSSATIAVFPADNGIITTMGILSDIQPQDMNLIEEKEAVSVDSVLSTYNYLKIKKV